MVSHPPGCGYMKRRNCNVAGALSSGRARRSDDWGGLMPFEFPDDAGFRAMIEQMKEHGGLAA
jgi:hypothetical protein